MPHLIFVGEMWARDRSKAVAYDEEAMCELCGAGAEHRPAQMLPLRRRPRKGRGTPGANKAHGAKC